ncbi:MAG TPA: CBS domain-containing protein [Anaerolineae bacterium]|nr:CBS domain-containing protein [Anaerolineae bacterium]
MLTVNDLMTLDPFTVFETATLREVQTLMRVEGYRQLPVVTESGELAGIVTDRDLRLALNSPMLGEKWMNETVLDNVRVNNVMTSNPICVTPDTPAYEAAEMLGVYKFGGMPVVDNGVLLGIISVTDFLEFFAENHKPETIEVA